MTKLSFRWLTLLGLVFSAGCGGDKAADEGQAVADTPAEETTPPEEQKDLRVLGTVPPFVFIDQHRNTFALDDVKGRVWIANFIFTQCLSTCPIQTVKMAALQESLKDEPFWSAVRMVSFTVDPENDSPEVLASYATKHKATPNWHFLTGARKDLWGFCEKGLMLPVDESGLDPKMPILHSPRIVLIDGKGQIRGYYDGLDDASLEKLKADMQVLLKETSSITGYNRIAYPNEIIQTKWLEPRAEQQKAMASSYDVFHDFKFNDRVQFSGVTFRNRVVEDACKNNIAGHYDHGNGIAVADVDGDGLLDVYLTTQLGSNELWKNNGNGTFQQIANSKLALADKISVAASFSDTDNDGDPDLFVTTTRGGNFFFENVGGGKFEDKTKSAGLDYSGHSSAGVFFDYDNDGLLDLFVCNVGVFTDKENTGVGGFHRVLKDAFAGHLKPESRNEASILYRNLGGNRFENVTNETGLVDVGWSGDASPIDLNDDGFLDLYVLNMQGHDHYWENVGGKTFKDRSRELFPKTPWGAMGVKVFDFDNNGRMDIFLTDMHSDMSLPVTMEEEKQKSKMRWKENFLLSGGMSIFGNALFRNDGEQKFTEVSDETGAENYWPWGLSVGDLNADGYDDAFITASMNYPFVYAVNSVLLNGKGKKFYDAEFVLGVEPRRERRTARPVFTLDPLGADKDHQMVKMGNLTKPSEMWGSLGSRSSVLFDLDNDGDLDVFTNEFNDGPMILISDLASKREIRWAKIHLEGEKSNRDGLGARVVVKAGGAKFTKIHDGKSGYLSQSRFGLYFGLDAATSIDEVVVSWPSGTTQKVAGPLETNRSITIRESEAK